MTAKALGTLSCRIEGRGQTVDYVEHFAPASHPEARLRIHIHVDTHASQAYGEVSKMTPNGWAQLAWVRGEALRTDLHIGYKDDRERRPAAFRDDRDQLLSLGREVL